MANEAWVQNPGKQRLVRIENVHVDDNLSARDGNEEQMEQEQALHAG